MVWSFYIFQEVSTKSDFRSILVPTSPDRSPLTIWEIISTSLRAKKAHKNYIILLHFFASRGISRKCSTVLETPIRSNAFILRSDCVQKSFDYVQGLCKFYVKSFSKVLETPEPWVRNLSCLAAYRQLWDDICAHRVQQRSTFDPNLPLLALSPAQFIARTICPCLSSYSVGY